MLTLTLPWPPSLNRIYRAVAGRVVLSEAARKYALQVHNALPAGRPEKLSGRLRVALALCPPAKLADKPWDIANREKLLFDCMTHAGVWIDDAQIDELSIVRGVPVGDGVALLQISEIGLT